jgi:hypothetical protein
MRVQNQEKKRMPAETDCGKSACGPNERLWGEIPVRLWKTAERGNPDGFLSILP